jgi:hypothetical protein
LFYAGHHSRDEEFAALKAEIERKNKAILDALTIDAKDGYSMHPDSVKILMKVMKKR